MQQRFKFTFNFGPADGLTIAVTTLVVAAVIGMLLSGLAFRPTGGQGRFAFGALNGAPQDKVITHVFARRGIDALLQALPDLLKRPVTDQSFMLPFA
nr:hypothetical protein [Notoacmeibacter marinus]